MKLPRRNFLHLAAGAARAPGRVAYCIGPRLSDAAGALDRRLPARRSKRHHGPPHGRVSVGATAPAVRRRRPPGAASTVATERSRRAQPDGYTVMELATVNAINATLYDKLNFDFVRDITVVAGIAQGPAVMVVNPTVPAKRFLNSSLTPRPIRARSIWVGRQRNAAAGHRRTVQDDGRRRHGARALSWLGARADRSDRRPHSGRVRAHSMPPSDTSKPDAAALGGHNGNAFGCAAGCADGGRVHARLRGAHLAGAGGAEGTPAEIIEMLNSEVIAALADPTLKARFADLGIIPMPMTPAECQTFITAEIEKWAKVIKFASIKPE